MNKGRRDCQNVVNYNQIEDVMNREKLKTETNSLIGELPENTSWDDLMYKIYVRQKIERGLVDSDEGKTYTTDEVRKQLGLM